jgi:hypothetical protein
VFITRCVFRALLKHFVTCSCRQHLVQHCTIFRTVQHIIQTLQLFNQHAVRCQCSRCSVIKFALLQDVCFTVWPRRQEPVFRTNQLLPSSDGWIFVHICYTALILSGFVFLSGTVCELAVCD